MGNKAYDKLYAYFHLATVVSFIIDEATAFEKNSNSIPLYFEDINAFTKEGLSMAKACQISKQELEPFIKFHRAYFSAGGVFKLKGNIWQATNPGLWRNPEMLEAIKSISVIIKDLNKEYLSTLPNLPESEVKLTEESPEADKKKHAINYNYLVSRGAFAMNTFFDDLIKNKKRIYGFETVQGKAYDIFYGGVFGEGEGAAQAELEAYAEMMKQREEERNRKKNEQTETKKEPEKSVEVKEQKPVKAPEPKKETKQKVKRKPSMSIGDFFGKFFGILAFPFVKAGQGIWWFLKHIGLGLGKLFSWIWMGICYCAVGIGRGFKAVFVSDDGSKVGLWFGLSILLLGLMALLSVLNVFETVVNFFNFGVDGVDLVYSSFSIVQWSVGVNQLIQNYAFLIWLLLLLPLIAFVVICLLIDLILTIITAIVHAVFHILMFILNILFQTVLPFAIAGFFIFMVIRAYLDSDRSVGKMILMIFSISLLLGSIVFFYL